MAKALSVKTPCLQCRWWEVRKGCVKPEKQTGNSVSFIPSAYEKYHNIDCLYWEFGKEKE